MYSIPYTIYHIRILLLTWSFGALLNPETWPRLRQPVETWTAAIKDRAMGSKLWAPVVKVIYSGLETYKDSGLGAHTRGP